MAQPNQQPYNAVQNILEFIATRGNYDMQNRLLGNLNLSDYMSLRHTTRRTLTSLDPINLQTQTLPIPTIVPQPNPPFLPFGGLQNPHPVAPPPNPPPPLPNHPNSFLHRKLGARCDDMRRITNVPIAQRQTPCPNGPTRNVRMRPCSHTTPQTHPPFPTRCFNVCDNCLGSWHPHLTRQITNSLPRTQSILCKRCSLRLRRQHGPGYHACTCTGNIMAGVKCHACRQEAEQATYAVGDARRHTLERTHVKHVGTKARRRRVLYVDNNPQKVRSRAACATAGCGREAWTKHHSRRVQGQPEPHFSRHARACLMCLGCSGEIVP